MSFFEEMNRRMTEGGLPITCATCVHLNSDTWQCARKSTCGGPFSGRDFPDYEGVLLRHRMRERCLKCGGAELTYVMVVPGTPTRFGLCAKHADVFINFEENQGTLLDRIVPKPVVIELPR